MGVYVSHNGGAKAASLSHMQLSFQRRLPLLGFARGPDGNPVKFYDFSNDVDYLEIRADTLIVDGQSATLADLADVNGVLTVQQSSGSSGQVTLSLGRSGHQASVWAGCYLHVRSSPVAAPLSRFFGNVLGDHVPFEISVTGYVYFGNAYGSYLNALCGAGVVTGYVTTSRTTNKTLDNSDPGIQDAEMIVLTTEKTSGGSSVQSSMTINSVKIGGQTVPLRFTSRIT